MSELKRKSDGEEYTPERIELSIVSYNVWMMPEMLRCQTEMMKILTLPCLHWILNHATIH